MGTAQWRGCKRQEHATKAKGKRAKRRQCSRTGRAMQNAPGLGLILWSTSRGPIVAPAADDVAPGSAHHCPTQPQRIVALIVWWRSPSLHPGTLGGKQKQKISFLQNNPADVLEEGKGGGGGCLEPKSLCTKNGPNQYFSL